MPLLIIVIIVLVITVVSASLVRIEPYQKGVLERLSRYVGTLEAGWHFVIPFIDSVKKVDMRERVFNTPSQEMITSDNAVVTIDAIVFTQINDPVKATYEIQDPILAVSNLSVTTLRAIIGTMTLDEVLGERAKINNTVQIEISQETAKWGLQISKIEVQRIDPPQDLMDAMNQQKIAQQLKRAKILEAEGLKEAAIREAEGIQQKQVLEADGQAQAIERVAEANAKALELESNAADKYFKGNAVLKEQLVTFEKALSNNTKYVVGSDMMDLVQSILKR